MNQIEFVRFLFTEDYQISKLLSRQRINNESGPVFILFNFISLQLIRFLTVQNIFVIILTFLFCKAYRKYNAMVTSMGKWFVRMNSILT